MSITAVSFAQEPYTKLDAYVLNPETIQEVIRSTAEYQIGQYGANIPQKNWLVGTFFSSFIAAHEATGEKWYLKQALKWGKDSDWDINNALHADDVCSGQTYLDLYFIKKDPKMIANLNEKLSSYFNRSEILSGELNTYDKTSKPFTGRNLWSWCDALYMAPPVLARMGKATGDLRYFEILHKLYWDTVDFLYDKDESLFYRDANFMNGDVCTPSGKNIFWGRGNGWVIGGLARTIEFLPQNNPMREKYIDLFTELAFSLAKYQQEDGLWRSSLNEPEWYPTKETSGSAFYVYAMAKGINEGWLPRKYFMPIVLKGWKGLMECVTPEGKLGYTQLVAGSPAAVRPNDSVDYAVGAFILAGCEMLKINGLEEMKLATNTIFQPQLLAEDGAWTWYNDERVIHHENTLYASYVKYNGKTALTAFAIKDKPSVYSRNEIILSTWQQSDDHNNASLLPLKNGGILANYATHDKTKSFYQRKIELPRWNAPKMSEEVMVEPVTDGKGLTYQNLIRLSEENDRIYNFFRGNKFKPNFIISDDDAESWSESVQLMANDTIYPGQRPYVKYVSNGKNRIDFFYTDGHPRGVKQNSIYHFFYTKDAFYTTTGELIRKIDEVKAHPILPSEGALVFDGSSKDGRGWVWDAEYDLSGNPYLAFISSPSGDIGTDMRYWTARYLNNKWETEQIAYAGSHLYPIEEHYAGGIALDPYNSERVVISADVHPGTAKPLPNSIHQLFKGSKVNGAWQWKQLTYDPVSAHLRPVIVRGRPNTLCWFTGDYQSYLYYHCNIMTALEF